jgi:site-specific recombinase XerD
MEKCTVKQTTEEFITHLKELGKKERTLYTYRKDLDVVEAFFGSDKLLTDIRVPQVGKFFKSDTLNKLPNGNTRAERTIEKTVRVFRMMMVWAKPLSRSPIGFVRR